MTFDARRPHETHAQHLHRLNKKCRREATTRAQQARDRQGHTDEDIRTRQARQAAESRASKERGLCTQLGPAEYEGPPDDGEDDVQYARSWRIA